MSDSSVNFRSVMRGYDPAQVDHHMNQLAQAAASVWQESAERTRQINDLKAANSKLKNELEVHVQRTHELEEAQMEAAAPTYTGLGERIGSVLTLIDNEAYEMRKRAQADVAKTLALAQESALATRQAAEEYAQGVRGAVDDEVDRILEEARQQASSLREETELQADSVLEGARHQADSVLEDADRQSMARQDADRQSMARREEAEVAYEMARASSAAAAIDFETTLAARREASALEFAAQVTAAEQQLASIRLRSEQARNDSERAQQESALKISQQLEQATARAHALVTEAKTKAERIKDNSERELAAASQRRDTINAQLTSVRNELAELGVARGLGPIRLADVAPAQNVAAADVQLELVAEVVAEGESEEEAEEKAEADI